MQFGFCYIPDYYEHLHGSYATWYRRLLHEWKTADALGYDAIWLAEHRFAGYAFSSTPVVAQAIADRTEQIRIGTAVALLPQRHPILTAEDWAAVDLLSGGRLNFGIGRGILGYDYATLGISSAQSRERFEEAWKIIQALWTRDRVSFQGKFWSFHDHTLGPKPVQKPLPPTFVACIATADSYRWAGEHGCHLLVAPFLLKSTDQQMEFLDIYRSALARSGHDPTEYQVIGNYHLAISQDGQAENFADEYLFQYLEFLNDVTSHEKSGLDKTQYAAYNDGSVLWQDAQQLRDHRAVIGNTNYCADRIGELAQSCGLTGWMFHINYGGIPHELVIDQMHCFAEEIVPLFNDRSASSLSATRSFSI